MDSQVIDKKEEQEVLDLSPDSRPLKYDKFDLVYIFLAAGLIGTVYETLLTLISRGVLEDRSGSILTPFNYVYGLGALLMFVALYRIESKGKIFLLGALLGGTAEFVFSWIQEVFLGSRSWDYSGKLLNILGRTTIPYMIVWGLMCLVVVYLVFPPFLRLIHKIPDRIRKAIGTAFFVLMCIDVTVTVTAIARYSQRAGGSIPAGLFTQKVDTVFNDNFMKIHFPNMTIK